MQEIQVQSPDQKDPLEEEMATTPVFLPGESHGQRSLRGYSPRGCKEIDMTEYTRMQVYDMFSYCLDLPLEFKLNVDRVLFTRYRAQ